MSAPEVAARAALALTAEGMPPSAAARIATTLDLPDDALDTEITDAVGKLRTDLPSAFAAKKAAKSEEPSKLLKAGADRYRAKHRPPGGDAA